MKCDFCDANAQYRDRESGEMLCLAHHFWGETEVDCFGKSYEVPDLPAHVACDGDRVVVAISYASEGDALNLVMLNVLPKYQRRRRRGWGASSWPPPTMICRRSISISGTATL